QRDDADRSKRNGRDERRKRATEQSDHTRRALLAEHLAYLRALLKRNRERRGATLKLHRNILKLRSQICSLEPRLVQRFRYLIDLGWCRAKGVVDILGCLLCVACKLREGALHLARVGRYR